MEKAVLRGFLFRNLRALLAGLGKPNGDRLLAARHFTAFAAGTRFQRAALLSPHCAFNGFARCLAVTAPRFLPR